RLIGHLRFLPGAAAVEQVDHDRAEDLVHDDIADAQVFDHAAATAAGLDADAAIGADEGAVADRDIAYAAGHFAADDHAAVAVDHRAVGDGDVLAGAQLAPAGIFG